MNITNTLLLVIAMPILSATFRPLFGTIFEYIFCTMPENYAKSTKLQEERAAVQEVEKAIKEHKENNLRLQAVSENGEPFVN